MHGSSPHDGGEMPAMRHLPLLSTKSPQHGQQFLRRLGDTSVVHDRDDLGIARRQRRLTLQPRRYRLRSPRPRAASRCASTATGAVMLSTTTRCARRSATAIAAAARETFTITTPPAPMPESSAAGMP